MSRNKTSKAPVSKKAKIDSEAAALLKGDEKLMRVARIHWGIYWKTIATGLLALWLLSSPILFNLGVFLCVVSVIMFGFATLYKRFLLLALTDQRVFLRHGIISLDSIQIRHSRIESVETKRTPMGMLLGYASVVIYGTGSRIQTIPFVGDALAFRNELDQMLSNYEERHTTASKGGV